MPDTLSDLLNGVFTGGPCGCAECVDYRAEASDAINPNNRNIARPVPPADPETELANALRDADICARAREAARGEAAIARAGVMDSQWGRVRDAAAAHWNVLVDRHNQTAQLHDEARARVFAAQIALSAQRGECVRCNHCGREASAVGSWVVGQYVYCARCIAPCSHCLDEQPKPYTYIMSNETLICRNCVPRVAHRCVHCGNYDLRANMTPYDGGMICGGCGEEQEESAQEAARTISDYHSSRRIVRPLHSPWADQRKRYLGVELEVEMKGGRDDERPHAAIGDILSFVNDNPNAIVPTARHAPLLFAEHDGSLENGAELITQPLGLDAHTALWQRLLIDKRAMFNAFRSHDTATCGLHVHVSRAGLSAFTISKAVCFVNDPKNALLVETIARRGSNHYCKKFVKKLSNAHTDPDEDRYQAVNLHNAKTVEFRIFKGSLEYASVMAAIEFANAVIDFAAQTSGMDLSTFSFLRFIHSPDVCADTKHLRPYLAKRSEALAFHILPEKVVKQLVPSKNGKPLPASKTPARPRGN